MKKEKYGKGYVIFHEGAVEECIYDIVSGSVEIVADYSKTTEKRLATLVEGEFFGELGMIEGLPRSATAVALERTELNIIEKDDLEEYLKSNPGKVFEIIRNTSHRVRKLTKDYLEACDAVAEYVKCQEEGKEKSPELLEKLKTIDKIAKGKTK